MKAETPDFPFSSKEELDNYFPYLMNRLAILKRQDQMPAEDNWTAMYGGSDAHSG